MKEVYRSDLRIFHFVVGIKHVVHGSLSCLTVMLFVLCGLLKSRKTCLFYHLISSR